MKRNMVIVGLLVVAVVAVVGIKKKKLGAPGATSCPGGVCTLPIPAGRPLSEDPKVGKPAPETLPVLLELGSTGCVACKAMAPIIDGLKETYAGKLDVEFVDVEKEREVAEMYGIQAIPTQIFFDADGNEIFRHTGFFPRGDIVAKWRELGYGFAEPQNRE
jgi:thioredoxin 1